MQYIDNNNTTVLPKMILIALADTIDASSPARAIIETEFVRAVIPTTFHPLKALTVTVGEVLHTDTVGFCICVRTVVWTGTD